MFLQTVADAARKEVDLIQALAADNPKFKLKQLTPDDVTFPMEKPLSGEQRLGDVPGMFPCLLVHIGSNGGVILVRLLEYPLHVRVT